MQVTGQVDFVNLFSHCDSGRRPGSVHKSIPLLEGTYPKFALEDLEFEHGDLLMRSALAQEGDRKTQRVFSAVSA